MAMREVDRRFRPRARMTPLDPRKLATGLGWVSLALGMAGALAPRRTARMIGVRDRGLAPTVLRLVGLRELASGAGILAQTRPAGWIWARAAGDAMDLALLGAAFLSPRTNRGRLMLATAAVAGVAAVDVIDAGELSRGQGTNLQPRRHAVAVRKAVTIRRSPEELYRFWRDFTNHPRFMDRVESVEPRGDRLSHWRARGPGGAAFEWDSEILDDQPGRLIAWRTRPGSRLDHEGVVRFEPAPGGRGTEVSVEMEYTPPAGVLGAALAKLLGQAPDQQLGEDLRRFKQMMEAGEIAVAAGPRAAGGGRR